jgi:hypothetical protein
MTLIDDGAEADLRPIGIHAIRCIAPLAQG